MWTTFGLLAFLAATAAYNLKPDYPPLLAMTLSTSATYIKCWALDLPGWEQYLAAVDHQFNSIQLGYTVSVTASASNFVHQFYIERPCLLSPLACHCFNYSSSGSGIGVAFFVGSLDHCSSVHSSQICGKIKTLKSYQLKNTEPRIS